MSPALPEVPRLRARRLPRLLTYGLLLLLAALLRPGASVPAAEPGISGPWDAAVDVGVMHVPFPFGIAVKDGVVSGWFLNGEERVVSAGGSFENGHLVLEFPTYARRLDARLGTDGILSGSYLPTTPGAKTSAYAFQAHRAGRYKDDPHPFDISGEWLIATQNGKAGENAWRLIAHQQGSQVRAAVLRVDGDSGELTGFWREGTLLLSHFDGARPSVIEITPAEGGALQVLVRDRHEGGDLHLSAYRVQEARARGVPEAADPARHTRMKDPAEPFRFSFPDLDGHLVSSTDSRFRGKVVVVDIGGSWCPNCHDEAPLLEDLYRKYHRQGLEIVTLSFEEEEQLANPTRLRAFIQRYGLDYTVLVAGTTDELHQKVPQAEGLDAYPTTFFIGRDGRVRAIHAGFAAKVTGEYNTRLQQDFTRQIEQLLAEKAPAGQGRGPS